MCETSVALQVKNKDQRFKEYENAPVTMENLWWINRNPYAVSFYIYEI
jgi:hypothetical protein